MAPGDWQDKWDAGAPFHKQDVHHNLSKHIDKLLAGRSQVKIFFPLCGKSVDMKWLYDMGHSIVGVEYVEQGVKEFFSEQQLEHTVSECEAVQGKLYQTGDGRLKLYVCDIYNFSNSVEGTFGAIWDRGSLVAINKEDRKKYAALMISLMTPDSRMLLASVEYNPSLYQGPPHCIHEYILYILYEDKCHIERLEFESAMTKTQIRWGLDAFYEKLHLLTLKD